MDSQLLSPFSNNYNHMKQKMSKFDSYHSKKADIIIRHYNIPKIL